MKRAASQSGFSLIELMIVIAIIGILTTIALPNFTRFQAKARQSEAKSQLAALYAAEKAFYAEWHSYWGDFRDIGFEPMGRLNYHIGFSGAGTAPSAPFSPSTTGTSAGQCYNTTRNATQCNFKFQKTSQLPTSFTAAQPSSSCGQGSSPSTPSRNAFLATAYGRISDDDTKYDVWSINEANVLCNNTPGI